LNSEVVLAPDGKLDIGEFALAIEHFALARAGDTARLRAVVEAGDFLARRARLGQIEVLDVQGDLCEDEVVVDGRLEHIPVDVAT